jgi:hypothetical protein
MADSDDILSQADRLMKRHRVFVAAGARAPEPERAATESEELPVLTEVVEGSTAPAPALLAPERIEAMARELLFDRLPVQRQAIADELAAWLDDELPQVVMRVLDGITDQLVTQVTLEARAALLPRLQAAIEAEAPPADVSG